MNKQLNIAFLIFNRPDTTKLVFEQIRRARPKRLFVIADGPRPGNLQEEKKCQAVRRIVDEGVDWDCEVFKNYSDVNLGCRVRPPTGLDWVFQHVDHCIILEDDCLPHPSFFPFCQDLLDRYRDDERIMMISGDNFGVAQQRAPYSYYFSQIPHIWGWATWKRAWCKYDIDMKLWAEIKRGNWLKDLFSHSAQVQHWKETFDESEKGFNTWDHQWTFACLVQNGLCIMPSRNLITNIGFNQHATHTTVAGDAANMPSSEISFPLTHPPFVIRDKNTDLSTFKFFNQRSGVRKLKSVFRHLFSGKNKTLLK
jgi:hypothetical protein